MTRIVATVVGGAALFAVGAYALTRSDPSAGSHPQRRFIESSRAASTIAFEDQASSLPVRPFVQDTTTRGGQLQEQARMLGALGGIGVTRAGAVVVLDAGLSHVRVYDSTGALLERFGREGEGPAEFKSARALAVSPNDEIAVYDLSGRIQVFANRDGKHELLRTLRPGRSVRSMCYLQDRLVFSGTAPNGAHAVATMNGVTGEILTSFGEIYRSPNPLINATVSEGRVACDPESERIFFATRAVIGEVRAYSVEGTLLWRTAIRGFKANIFRDAPDGFTTERSPSGIHALHALAFVPGVGLFAQYSFRTADELRERVGARADHTLLLDARTGAPSRAAESWPLIGAIRGSILVSTVEDPAPGIAIGRIAPR
jgi:hypothetical protein